MRLGLWLVPAAVRTQGATHIISQNYYYLITFPTPKIALLFYEGRRKKKRGKKNKKKKEKYFGPRWSTLSSPVPASCSCFPDYAGAAVFVDSLEALPLLLALLLTSTYSRTRTPAQTHSSVRPEKDTFDYKLLFQSNFHHH